MLSKASLGVIINTIPRLRLCTSTSLLSTTSYTLCLYTELLGSTQGTHGILPPCNQVLYIHELLWTVTSANHSLVSCNALKYSHTNTAAYLKLWHARLNLSHKFLRDSHTRQCLDRYGIYIALPFILWHARIFPVYIFLRGPHATISISVWDLASRYRP